MQKVNFDFEILIHDDASTDNTQEIIKRIVGDDDRFKLILREKNIKSTGGAVFPILFNEARGKYIALCEGDDYWIDDQKLQLQVDLFMQDSEIRYVFSDNLIDENGSFFPSKTSNKQIPNKLNLHEILKINIMPATASVMFERKYVPKILDEILKTAFHGDWVMLFLIAGKGKIGYINKPLVTYRRGVGILTKTSLFVKFLNGFVTNKIINEYTEFEYDYHIGKQEWHLENIVYALIEDKKLFKALVYFFRKIYRSLIENKPTRFLSKNLLFMKHTIKLLFKMV